MSTTHRKQRLKNIENTGFGTNSGVEGGRLTNKDGSTNLRKTGLPVWNRISIYHTLLRMKRGRFFLLVILFYTSVNLVFASLYFAAGIQHLTGAEIDGTAFDRFMEAFFFSSQTLTTVGYGHVAPVGMLTNSIASIESLVGILIFAVVTGLMYGRFSRPRAFISFSDNILVAPYKSGRALMARIATFKNNLLTDAEALMTVALHVQEDGKRVTRFYTLPLEINKVNSLALSWTLVHALDENSPMYNFSHEDFMESRMEIILGIKAFDDHFSNIVQQRTSYTYQEVVYGARFLPMFHRAENGRHTVLELDKINYHEPVHLPEPQESESIAANA